jgi:hypothetical protein
MKTALRVIGLILTALMGFWLLAHGIVIGVTLHHRISENQDVLGGLVEGSVFVAGGICVLSIAVQQFYCWRTHHQDGGLI